MKASLNSNFALRPLSLIIIFVVVFLLGCAREEEVIPTSTPPKKDVEVTKNISYSTGEFKEQTLDLYLPTGYEGPYPTILMIHQGNGNKEQLLSWGHALAKIGYASISINHRQWPEYSYPDHLEDAFCALAWIYDNSAVYSFDTQNIYALGHSAGGTLAAILGVIDQTDAFTLNCPDSLPEEGRLQGVITFTGIFDYPSILIEAPELEDYVTDLLGGNQVDIPEIWNGASASTWVDGSEPPFLIIHGEGDHSIPPDQSRSFADLLENSGVEVELILVPGASHTQIAGLAQSLETVELFLKNLIKR